jgi:hypothetical protein
VRGPGDHTVHHLGTHAPAIPALQDGQRIGFEVEAADVTLKMGGYVGDTYGFVPIQTSGGTVLMTLEERKGNENPKVEAQTSPQAPNREELRQLKQYLNQVLDLAHGRTAAQWAAEASRLVFRGQRRNWIVGAFPPELAGNVFQRTGTGARLVQSNTDVYLNQLLTAPDLMKSMIRDGTRKGFYDAARARAEALVGGLAEPAKGRVGGLLALALYSGLCEHRWGRVEGSLGKDRTQPLMKVGVDDLARLALNPDERASLLAIVDAETRGDGLATLSRATSMTGTVDQGLVDALRTDLQRWFLTSRPRYTDGGVDPRPGLYGEAAAWDVVDAGTGKLMSLGNTVNWGTEWGATPTGKPIPPKLVNGDPMLVLEARQSSTPFNDYFYNNL